MDRNGHPQVLLVLLVVISALSIVGESVPASVRDFLLRPLPALVLLAVHALLHVRKLKHVIAYHAVQSVIVAGIGVVSASVSPVIALTAWMCGETVAAETRGRTRLLATTWHAAVGLSTIVLVAGVESAVQWIVAAVPTVAFVIVVILLYARESRARESAEELARELADSNRRIAEYAEQAAFRSREQERQRMARDLHDTLAQGLTGVILQIRAAGAHLDAGRSKTAGTILADSLGQAQQTLSEARKAIADLREADALTAAGTERGAVEDARAFLRRVCDDLSRRYARPVDLVHDETELRSVTLPGSTLFEVSGIVQEAVHNAVRHGACRRVDVRLSPGDALVELEITDDGSGFDPEALPERGHYGIQGMHERATTVGGNLLIESEKGHGTTLRVTVPVEGAAERPAEQPGKQDGSREEHDG